MSLKLLYLGNESPVSEFLSSKGILTITQEKITSTYASKFDWIVSYGYRHIIKKGVIDVCKNPIINLHISFLPWNRGADPNFWSWLENTPKGVTIHQIDSGIDTGDIYIQKEVIFSEKETLSSSYNILKLEIEKLFIDNFDNIINFNILPKKQKGVGSFHLSKDLQKFKHLLTQSWDTNVNKLKMTDLEIIDEVEKVRTKNNKNWMDILRVAFKHAPEEARPILAEINKSDGQISRLLDQLANNK